LISTEMFTGEFHSLSRFFGMTKKNKNKHMKVKILFPFLVVAALVFTSCSKGDDDLAGGGGTTPIAAKTMLNVAYGTDPLQKMDIYLPANRTVTSTKVIILVHGGAWIAGDKNDYTAAIDTLKNRMPDYAIFNINYRLAALPATNVFPAQEMDVKAAVEFIYSNRATNLVSDKFVMMGASAGGHLALLQAYKYQAPVKIKAVVDYCGPTDMAAMYTDYAGTSSQLGITLLMGGTPTSNPTLYASSSPITTAYANATNACPTIIFQGTADLIVNANTQSVALKNKLTAATVPNEYYPYAGLGHIDTWTNVTLTDTYAKIQAFLTTYVQ
jgi:acetyl esterase/lipase